MKMAPEDILNFWVYEVGSERWFRHDPLLAQKIRDQFMDIYEQARQGQLEEWKRTPESALALILLLDIFPRQMFRGTAQAYETDAMALDLARDCVIAHFDDRIDKTYKLLFYLPFQHSENMGDQRLAIFYIRERTKDQTWLKSAEDHFNAVWKWGRFPERNQVLNRASTAEEISYLEKNAHLAEAI